MMAHFICELTPSDDSPPLAPETLTAHQSYLGQLYDEGTLVAAGPIDNPPAGVVILRADDRAAAEKIMSLDPAVSDGGQLALVREWSVAFGLDSD